MKGDFSRLRQDTGKHYTDVVIQQGRVQLDSDANEQRAIDTYLRSTMLRDVVGFTGAPQNDPGFAITPSASGTSLTIGAGRFYVNGLMCETLAPLDFTAQPNLASAAPSIASVIAALQAKTYSAVRIYLEAWQRFVTPIDDPAIHEVALGAADTAGRLQTMWRVSAGPILAAPQIANVITAVQALQTALNALPASLGFPSYTTQLARALTALQAAGAGTAAITITSGVWSQISASITGFSGADVATFDAVVATSNALGLLLASQPSTQDCCAMPVFQPQRIAGTLMAQAQPAAAPSPGMVAPASGYRGLENQLYRVEIHTGGTAAQATFKWSRDNGSVLTSVLSVNGSTLTVNSLGPDTELGFAANQWVELSDDSSALLADPPEQPGTLVQIKVVDPTQSPPVVTLMTDAPTLNTAAGHAKMRRWDQASGAVAIAAGTWVALENGVQVQFSATGTYNAGDYWMIPARTATGTIDWPTTTGASPVLLPQAPRSTNVSVTPLACLHLDSQNHITVENCRTLFQPLGSLTPPPPSPPALHVNAISWLNDDLITLDMLSQKGLSITLDGSPTGPVDSRNFLVTVQMPFPVALPVNATPGGQVLLPVVLTGQVTNTNGTLAWTLPENTWGEVAVLSALSEFYVTSGLFMQARVTLKGHAVMGSLQGAPVWLDGQAFGKPGTRYDGSSRVDLTLPSGNGAKASDFESWFSVAPVAVPTLVISPTSVTLTAAASSPAVTGTVSLSFNALAATTVLLSIQQTQTAPTVAGGAGIATVVLGSSNYITIPPNVVLPKGSGTPNQTFPIRIIANPGANTTATVTIAATAQLASGINTTAAATLTIIGFTPTVAPAGPPFNLSGTILQRTGSLTA